ncbi:WYL domain-containing protein [Akkermansiaceae bacterium]|nr:WYL domain-containing protein [Akkermansiaceae bacterium]
MGNFVRKDSWLGSRQLRYVEELAWWTGIVTRPEVIKEFKISAQQGSAVIQQYLEMNPKSMQYCLKKKRYLVNPKMKRIFGSPDLESQLSEEAGEIVTLAIPKSKMNDTVQRYLTVAMRNKREITVSYQSRSGEDSKRRKIAPQAFGNDGNRIHVRAWCFENEDYRDFSLLRMSNAKFPEDAVVEKLPEDKAWTKKVSVKFFLNKDLDKATKNALMEDYGMKKDTDPIVVKTTEAMLPYAKIQMGIDPISDKALEGFFTI